MLTTDQKNLILYQAQVWVSDTGYDLLEKEKYSEPCDDIYAKAFKAINYITVLQDADVALTLTDKQQEVIYKCLQDSLTLGNYPVAGIPFTLAESVLISQGSQGLPGTPGAPGADGTDADIDVVGHPDGNITVVISYVGPVKTATIQYTPYVLPGITILLDEGVIPDPDQARVVELGNVISTLGITVNLVKGRNAVTASTVTAPGALNTAYQSALNLTSLNSVGSQAVAVSLTNVAATVTITVNITDGINTPSDTELVTFVYPYLYGQTGSTSTAALYAALSKLVKTEGDHSVPFLGTDQYFWFGLPVEYAAITRIEDENGFEVTGAFTLVATISVTSTPYGGSNWTHNYNFYRTTEGTTIDGVYTFIR
jgi:hypothetical protein